MRYMAAKPRKPRKKREMTAPETPPVFKAEYVYPIAHDPPGIESEPPRMPEPVDLSDRGQEVTSVQVADSPIAFFSVEEALKRRTDRAKEIVREQLGLMEQELVEELVSNPNDPQSRFYSFQTNVPDDLFAAMVLAMSATWPVRVDDNKTIIVALPAVPPLAVMRMVHPSTSEPL